MTKIKSTAGRLEAFVSTLGKGQEFMGDASAPGLVMRANPRGDSTFLFQSKLNGKSLRISIGGIGNRPIPEAQAEARRLQTLTEQGHDPRQIRNDKLRSDQDARDERQAQELALQQKNEREKATLGDVWPIYIEDRQAHWSAHHLRGHWQRWLQYV